jgi:hypothetical protein
LGAEKQIGRIEFMMDNPWRKRGQYRDFEIQARQGANGWSTDYRGRVYGTLFSKRVDPFQAEGVRLVVDGEDVGRLELYSDL